MKHIGFGAARWSIAAGHGHSQRICSSVWWQQNTWKSSGNTCCSCQWWNTKCRGMSSACNKRNSRHHHKSVTLEKLNVVVPIKSSPQSHTDPPYPLLSCFKRTVHKNNTILTDPASCRGRSHSYVQRFPANRYIRHHHWSSFNRLAGHYSVFEFLEHWSVSLDALRTSQDKKY